MFYRRAIKEKIGSLMATFSMDIGVDLGTSNTLVYVRERGVVIDEPTMLACQKRKRWTGLAAPRVTNRKVVAYGYKAKEMLNREPKQLEVISPLKNGVISDLEATQELINYYLKLVYEIPSGHIKIFKPRVVVGVPGNITEVEKRAVGGVFKAAGAREVIIVEESILAALGVGMPIETINGMMLVTIGGGKTEATVLSMGGVVLGQGIKTGGGEMDSALINYLKMKYGMLVGQNTAEKTKIEIGSLATKKTSERKSMVVRGRDLESGLPKSVKVSEEEVAEAISLSVQKIAALINNVLDQTPPELLEDILQRGIVLTGKGALLNGLDKLIESETKIAVHLVDEPGLSVVKGAGMLLENRQLLGSIKLVGGW